MKSGPLTFIGLDEDHGSYSSVLHTDKMSWASIELFGGWYRRMNLVKNTALPEIITADSLHDISNH